VNFILFNAYNVVFNFLIGVERLMWGSILIISFIFSGQILQKMFREWESNPVIVSF